MRKVLVLRQKEFDIIKKKEIDAVLILMIEKLIEGPITITDVFLKPIVQLYCSCVAAL